MDRSLVPDRFAGADLIDGFFAREEGSCCDRKFELPQPAWLERKKTRDERILESARLPVAEEEDSCHCRLKIPEKPLSLLLRPAVAEGGRALILKPERKEDNPVL
ncbi:hypothetical protein AAC387_Pa05g0447 [Persea americana]